MMVCGMVVGAVCTYLYFDGLRTDPVPSEEAPKPPADKTDAAVPCTDRDRDRHRQILGDIDIEALAAEGFANPNESQRKIADSLTCVKSRRRTSGRTECPRRRPQQSINPYYQWARLSATFRFRDPITDKMEERFVLNPGSDITLITAGGDGAAPVFRNFAFADYFKCDVNEFDSNHVYVPLETLQEMRHLPNRATSIQIKLKVGCYEKSSKQIKAAIEAVLAGAGLITQTWEER